MTELEEKFAKLKVIISEVDGILTTDELPMDELGNVPFKKYYRKDFEAINLIKKHFKVVFLSADNAISYNMFRRKNIPFYFDPRNKSGQISEICRRYGVNREEILYIGCSYSDIECMQQVPFSMCTSDAITEVKSIATQVIDSYGGMGVFCYLYDAFIKYEIRRRLTQDG